MNDTDRHECDLPQGPNLGLSGVSEVWVCPECGRQWQFVKPWGMYPGWRTVQEPVGENGLTATETRVLQHIKDSPQFREIIAAAKARGRAEQHRKVSEALEAIPIVFTRLDIRAALLAADPAQVSGEEEKADVAAEAVANLETTARELHATEATVDNLAAKLADHEDRWAKVRQLCDSSDTFRAMPGYVLTKDLRAIVPEDPDL